MEVPRVHTPLSWDSVTGQLSAAYRALTGSTLPTAALPYLLAMLHVENRGGDAIYNHNWGNVTTTSDAVPYFFHKGIPLRFRSFDSPVEGARAFFQTLLNRINRPAFEAMARNDFDAWFDEIRAHYAAPPPGHQGLTEQHRTNYRYLVNKFRNGGAPVPGALNSDLPHGSPPLRTTEGAGALFLMVIVAAGAAIWLTRKGRRNG